MIDFYIIDILCRPIGYVVVEFCSNHDEVNLSMSKFLQLTFDCTGRPFILFTADLPLASVYI